MSELHTSDLQISVSAIKHGVDLIGYRNLLSYTSSLGIRVLPKSSLDQASWSFLGSGSYSTTWRAILGPGTGQAVAVKQPNASFTRAKAEVENLMQHEALSMLIQELRILAHPKLKSHPNLPPVLGAFFQEENSPPGIRPCLVFDLAVSDLYKYLRGNCIPGINHREMIELCSDIAHGICALNAYGLVHGDIKPNNILLFLRDNRLTATVGDLGTCGVPSQTCGIIPGTFEYWAPECHPNSPFRQYANEFPRDLYSFGLVIFSVLTYCKEPPFPSKSRFSIQHDDILGIKSLLSKIPTPQAIPQLQKVLCACIRADPAARTSILDVCQQLDTYLGCNRQFDEIQDLAETALLTDPDNPRVNALGQMPLQAHFLSKLLSEYTFASHGSDNFRLSLTMAAFYSGAVGPGIERPWDVVAAAQWLLKAVELGSHAAVSAIFADSNVLRIVEEFGSEILKVRRPIFSSPCADLPKLLSRLNGFAAMPDNDSLNLLVFLGGEISEEAAQQSVLLTTNKDELQQKVRKAVPGLSVLEKFTLNRDADLGIVDSDAFDIILSNASNIVRTVYNNDLEGFITLGEESGLESGDDKLQYFMATAIFNGSIDIVRYLLAQYDLSADDSWENMTHFNHSVLYRRLPIVELFLERGVTISPANGDKLSALHLASRHDDEQLIRLICEHLKASGNLSIVLESKTTEGPLAGSTAVFVAMICGAWENVHIMLAYGADPNSESDGSRLIDFTVQPMSPAAPISILQTLLQNGAIMDRVTTSKLLPLQWAVQSSNVLAVFHLLLHGASLSFPNLPGLISEAESIEEEMKISEPVEVLDEDGRPRPNGWNEASEASSLIVEMLRFVFKGENNWSNLLRESINASSKGCRGKMWIADKIPPTMLIEVLIPCS